MRKHSCRHRMIRIPVPLLLILLFSKGSNAFQLPSSFRGPWTPTNQRRSPPTTSVFLLGTGSNQEDDDEDKKQDNIKNDDLQLDAWIRGIGQQWPLRPEPPSTPRPMDDGEPEIPLAALLNLEALLSFTKIEPETKKSIDNLIDSISSVLKESSPVLKESSPQLSQWDRWITRAEEEEKDAKATSTSQITLKSDNSRFIKQATLQLESILVDASALVSPSNIQGLIAQASNLVALGSNATISGVSDLAKRITEERGIEVTTQELNDATNLAASIVKVADALRLRPDTSPPSSVDTKTDAPSDPRAPTMPGGTSSRARALFSDFATASEVTVFSPVIGKAAEMGALAGAIYEESVDQVHELNHTVVARGMTEDVCWMVTDALATMTSFDDTAKMKSEDPFLVRTITIRGFDASDEQVDRERLLNNICSAAPESIKPIKGVVFHSGLLAIARAIYAEMEPLIDWTAPNHKLVINGHSVGGSIASLLLILMATDRGLDFVMDKVLRVYTFGSPPVMALSSKGRLSRRFAASTSDQFACEILDTIGLPSDMIFGFVQPWDPVVRLFSEIDALYPLIGDLGDDGVTPYANGPPRSLRPITKRIIEAWEGWPIFRENYRSTGSQRYRSAGMQHILLAEPVRYVADRFFPVNIAVPPIEAFLQISSSELLQALKMVFPLDVFEVSFVPQAIRSFVHHFYPAYGTPMMEYIARLKRKLGPAETGSIKSKVNGDDELYNDEEPCTVYVMQQENGTSVVVDMNKWAEANE